MGQKGKCGRALIFSLFIHADGLSVTRQNQMEIKSYVVHMTSSHFQILTGSSETTSSDEALMCLHFKLCVYLRL